MRLDKFLFFTRIFKSRSLAAKFILSGKVRINGSIVNKGHRKINFGEMIIVNKFDKIKIIRVIKFPQKRGSYSESQMYYDDLTPKEEMDLNKKEKVKPFVSRTGRPTKMDRRKIDKLMGRN